MRRYPVPVRTLVKTHYPLLILTVGVLAAVYPGVWSVGQIASGWASDRFGRKWMIASGMWLQVGGILLTAAIQSFGSWLVGAVRMGLGTALVYPTLLVTMGDVAHPSWRTSAVGVLRRTITFVLGHLLPK